MRCVMCPVSVLSMGMLAVSGFWHGAPVRAEDAVPPSACVVIGSTAGQIEQFAAAELCGYLNGLYGLRVQPTHTLIPGAQTALLVGDAENNPAIRAALGAAGWPAVSDQGIVLKRSSLDGIPALVVGGGSARATLWAVYELAERWGVRFLLRGDVLPAKRERFELPDADIVLEPNLRIRQWRVINALAIGPESWGISDYRRVLDQLAKLKFNRIYAHLWSWQPFVHYESGGIARSSATLFFGFDLPIVDDMPGRAIFGSAKRFWNPDLPQNASYEALSAAGRQLVQNVIHHARLRGMQCVINVNLDEFPPEFSPLIKGVQKGRQLGDLTVVPGADTPISDPALTQLATSILKATVNTYPEADYLTLGVKEQRQWVGRYEEDWKALDERYGVERVRPLAELLATAARREDYPGGAERAVNEVKGDIVSLRYYDRLFNDLKVLKDTRRPDLRLIYNGFAEELYPVMSRVVPRGAETLNFVDYTPSRIVQRKQVLENIGASDLPSTLIYTLHDDNVGILPQLATGSLHALTGELRRCGWAGFSTRYWLIGDHDPCVAYLSRAAWDARTTPEGVYRDQVAAVCGEACVDDLRTVFREVEAATLILEKDGLGLTFPVPNMLRWQWKPGELPASYQAIRQNYRRALDAARRALKKTKPSGRPYVDYWVGRLEFGVGYFDMLESVRRAAIAESRNDFRDALAHTRTARAEAGSALEAYARVAADQSDRGAIATMGAFVYRPIQDKLAQFEAKRPEKP